QITSAVNTVLVDDKGLLWIGTMSQGVYTYNLKQNVLHKEIIENYDLGASAVWSIIEDKSGMIWAGTRSGLMRYNTQINKFETIDNLFSKTENSDNEVLSILEDSAGNLWLGTWSA